MFSGGKKENLFKMKIIDENEKYLSSRHGRLIDTPLLLEKDLLSSQKKKGNKFVFIILWTACYYH